MYYGLSNFYQNHRRYFKARDDYQLNGVFNTPSTDCEPFAYSSASGQREIIVPCGSIANSFFNDSFSLTFFIPPNSGRYQVNLTRTGIAWPSDVELKYGNPSGFNPNSAADSFKHTQKPPNWSKSIWQLPNALKNEDFVVWMRTAAFPSFKKTYASINRNQQYFVNGLAAGNYSFQVQYAYPVLNFNGTKRIVLSTTTVMGGKNPFLGIAYIVVGSLFLVVGVVMVIFHLKYGKNMSFLLDITPFTPYFE
jgi:archaellin